MKIKTKYNIVMAKRKSYRNKKKNKKKYKGGAVVKSKTKDIIEPTTEEFINTSEEITYDGKSSEEAEDPMKQKEDRVNNMIKNVKFPVIPMDEEIAYKNAKKEYQDSEKALNKYIKSSNKSDEQSDIINDKYRVAKEAWDKQMQKRIYKINNIIDKKIEEEKAKVKEEEGGVNPSIIQPMVDSAATASTSDILNLGMSAMTDIAAAQMLPLPQFQFGPGVRGVMKGTAALTKLAALIKNIIKGTWQVSNIEVKDILKKQGIELKGGKKRKTRKTRKRRYKRRRRTRRKR